MKKIVLAAASGLVLLTVAACSDSTDSTTTQSVTPMEETAPVAPATPAPEVVPAPDAAPMDAAPADDATDPSAPKAIEPAPAPIE